MDTVSKSIQNAKLYLNVQSDVNSKTQKMDICHSNNIEVESKVLKNDAPSSTCHNDESSIDHESVIDNNDARMPSFQENLRIYPISAIGQEPDQNPFDFNIIQQEKNVKKLKHRIFANELSKTVSSRFCVRSRPHLWMTVLGAEYIDNS